MRDLLKKVLISALVAFSLNGAMVLGAETQPTPHSSWSFTHLGLTPVQSGGRLKPFDSFAREVVLFETGSQSFQKWGAMDLLFSWITNPDAWELKPLIRINREDVKRQLGLEEKRTHFSPRELMSNLSLSQYADELEKNAQAAQAPGAPKLSAREQELKTVLDRLSVFHNIVSGQGWLVVPRPAPEAWGSILDHSPQSAVIRSHFVRLIRAYQAPDQEAFERETVLFRSAVEGEIIGFSQKVKNSLLAESLYNRTRPFFYSWVFYLVSALLWAVSSRANVWRKCAAFTLISALLTQIVGITLRCFASGRPPVTNMYESVIWVSLGVMIFAMVLYAVHRQRVILSVSSFLATFALIAADFAPAILDPSIHPLVPVLRSNYWLTVHVLTITLGYAAFMLALGLSNFTLFQFMKKVSQSKIASLNQMTYRSIQFGVVFITAGTILGGIWADYSWGRFWGWDPKEVWALITLLCYLVILHGRYTNWIGPFGFAAWSSISFLSVVMAWYGVNFILGVGLHSYGFASGGTPWVLGFVALEVLYVVVASLVRHAQKTGSLKFWRGKNSVALH
jgi:cytochrome c-type biogenesis protein CcsB